MSIYSNKSELKIEGNADEILAELSMIIFALKRAKIPNELIRIAIDNGIEEYNKRNKKEEKKDNFKSILKKLGLEE